jgi:hypothetical protein
MPSAEGAGARLKSTLLHCMHVGLTLRAVYESRDSVQCCNRRSMALMRGHQGVIQQVI